VSVELRCETGRLFGILDDGVIEVKCNATACKRGSSQAVIIHRFDPHSGILLETKKFLDPAKTIAEIVRKGEPHGVS
jgi:hypothetical protein